MERASYGWVKRMWYFGDIPPEIQEIARLQRMVLPDAIPSLLGFRYTCAFTALL
jgi:hypothetical protein